MVNRSQILRQKKAQGLGGLIKVIVVGIFFFATFPFMSSAFNLASNAHTGTTKWLISGIVFVVVYLFINFAYKLGGDSLLGGYEE